MQWGYFYLESEILEMPNFAHDAIGIISFFLTSSLILVLIKTFKDGANFPTLNIFDYKKNTESSKPEKDNLPKFIFFGIICFFVFFATNSFNFQPVEKEVSKFPQNFPNEFEGRSIKQLELTEREEMFMRGFPGEIRRFTDGNREIIFRHVNTATRKLHPASDCFLGIGFSVKPLPVRIDSEKNKWSCFKASKNGEILKVCERIYTKSGESWTDVSSWYWAALGDPSPDWLLGHYFCGNLLRGMIKPLFILKPQFIFLLQDNDCLPIP